MYTHRAVDVVVVVVTTCRGQTVTLRRPVASAPVPLHVDPIRAICGAASAFER